MKGCLRTVLGIKDDQERKTEPIGSIVPQLVTRHTVAENIQRQRVLVVEDNIVNQKLAVRMVEKLGYRPDVVDNGQEALVALTKDDMPPS